MAGIRQRGQRERERERGIVDWGERERMEMRIENGVGFKRGQNWLILTDGLNEHMYFWMS
jgi:hypothetical protein